MLCCAFNNCPNEFGQLNKTCGIIFHTFPTTLACRQEWINVVRVVRAEPDWTPTKCSRVCTLHFSPGQVFGNIRGEKRILRGAVPSAGLPEKLNEGALIPDYLQPVSEEDRHKVNLQDCANLELNESVDQEAVVEDDMDVDKNKVEVPGEGTDDNLSTDGFELATTALGEPPDDKDEKRKLLEKFKRRLVRRVSRQIAEKRPENEMWKELNKSFGFDCEKLWQQLRELTLKKLKRLLPVNDLLRNLKPVVRLTPTDWLFFDLIMVHEKINVISVDGENGENENKEEPECLRDLFELIKEHKVERLSGDDLTEAWIRVTLKYNSRGRKCSPMLLQLRWYQMKELTRARFYSFWCAYRGNHRILDRAMKHRPTHLQTEIAGEYKNIITRVYPEWEQLIEERRVILSEEFLVNRKARRNAGSCDENDVEIEVIEPLVETITLEVDSDEEHVSNNEKIPNTENSIKIKDNISESTRDCDENEKCCKNSSDNISTTKSESEEEVLELDGLSDVEEMPIPLENPQANKYYENPNENPNEMSEEILSGTLPKITNVMGNVNEQTQLTDEQEINAVNEKNNRNDSEDVITDTTIVANQCLETEDMGTVQYESDREMNDILHENVNNLMNIEITKIKSECDPDSEINNIDTITKISTNLQDEEQFNSANYPSCSGDKLPLCGSEDENDEVRQEKANNYTGIELSLSNFENIEKSHHENPITPEIIEQNECSNEHVHRETDKEDKIVQEEETIKNEKYYDGFDEFEIDNTLIKFEDDGIEFVEEVVGKKKKITNLKIQPEGDYKNESTTKVDDFPQIDVKLLMDPTVYTKKLDKMDIFKFRDYKFVNDNKVIESAILESKPFDKLALKHEDIMMFREQATRGYDMDRTQSDNDAHSACEYTSDTVKCTSWMLQKPKNRTYNPIKLCKNPDFNTRLKRLTAGFFSSSRNRELLKECKPLTIDLHKAFEKKLINGTMYLRSGDFKAVKYATIEKIKNEPVSVVPSVIPGQSIFTASTTNNASVVVPEKINNQEDNLSIPTVEKNAFNERSKVINLPDIDQVRRVNQSLLTAEVSPIRVDNKINNPDVCIQPEKATIVEPEFVQPIVVVPIVDIKNELSDLNLDDKTKIQLELDIPLYESNSRQDLMANKINDQINHLSSQISEVENNDLLGVGVEQAPEIETLITNKIEQTPKANNSKPPRAVNKAPYVPNKLTYVPSYRGNLTWSPKYPKNHIADSLLTLDTLSKILFLLNGNEEEIRNCTCKKKKLKKFLNKVQPNDSIINQKNKDGSAVTKDNDVIDSNTDKTGQPKKKKISKPNRKPRTTQITKYSGMYCCWAREKIISVNANKPDPDKHGCLGYKCQCCCKQELIKLCTSTMVQRKPNKWKINPSTIVLSDDDEKTKVSQNHRDVTMSDAKPNDAVGESSKSENKSSTSSIVIGESNQVTFELMPSLAPITKTKTNAATNDVNNTAIQSKVSEEFSIEKLQQILDQEREFLKKRKLCKTVVHSASTYNNNQSTGFNSSIGKDKGSSTVRNSVKASDKIDKKTPKIVERTLFLNSNQILSKPTKSPVYLGRNKILLCSLKNPKVVQTPLNNSLPILPYGVNFVMLPNGELTLTIDNGVQLDAEKFSTLPALMSMVQEEYLKSNISQVPGLSTIRQEIGNINTIDKTNASEVHTTHNIENKSTECNSSATEDNGKNALSELSSPNVNDVESRVSLPVDSENAVPSQITVSSEIMNTESECLKSAENHQETETQVESQITESHSTDENQVNLSQTTESVIQSAEPCLNDNNDTCKNSTANTRTTLLSDLMEMSGISAEDTNIVSEEYNINITPLPPNIIPVTKTNGSEKEMLNKPTNSKVSEDVAVAGPYSNLLSFEPNTPINQLLNYIARIRPELNAVTSFADIRYVCANNGQFYKLDVDTGYISEISVIVKKNPKSDLPTIPKVFIDLTDDACDEENVTCAEFLDIPPDKQRIDEVKPIKMFKAVHPGILKRTGRSILKGSEVVYPKKPIHISKQRRKQLLSIANKYVLINVDEKNKFIQPEDPPVSHMDSSYDTSDEEPLAKKRKHNKSVEEDIEEPIPLFEDMPCNSFMEDTTDTPDLPVISGEFGDMSDLEINSMDIEGVNPELHPVAFEEGSESDEDNCILGV